MKSLGISTSLQTTIFKALSAILHIGNLTFTDALNDHEACTVKNAEILEVAAGLLGISEEVLTEVMVYRRRMVGRDAVSVLLKAAEAEIWRDRIANGIYEKVVLFLIGHCNERLVREGDFMVSILQGSGIGVEMRGNYGDERIKQLVGAVNFERMGEELKNDGVDGIQIGRGFVDNQGVIDLFDGTSRMPGLWHLLKEGGAKEELIERIERGLKANAAFVPIGAGKVGVRHGNTVIEYEVEGEEDSTLFGKGFLPLFGERVMENFDVVFKLMDGVEIKSVFVIDGERVREELESFGIGALIELNSVCNVDPHGMLYEEFCDIYSPFVGAGLGNPRERIENSIIGKDWSKFEYRLGNTRLFLGKGIWEEIAELKKAGNVDPITPAAGLMPGFLQVRDDDCYSEYSDAPSADSRGSRDEVIEKRRRVKTGDIELGVETVQGRKEIVTKVESLTTSRKIWVCVTWSLTWWVPSIFLKWCGKMKRADVRIAWREKVALCVIIGTMCLSLLFLIIGLRYVICPPINVLTQSEVMTLSTARGSQQAYFTAYGNYFHAEELMSSHLRSFGDGSGPGAVPNYIMTGMYGSDVSILFYRQDSWATYCPKMPTPPNSWDNMDPSLSWQKRDSLLPQIKNIHRNTVQGQAPSRYVDNLYKYTAGKVGWALSTIAGISSASQVN